MLVKASSITNLTDARYFAAKEARFLGFCLEEGAESYIDPIEMRSIREWVEGPAVIGEFPATNTEHALEAARFFGLDGLQLPLSSRLPDLKEKGNLILLLEIELSTPDWLDRCRECAADADYFILKCGMDAHPERLLPEGFFREFPLLLQSDLPARELLQLLERLQPAGICLSGGEEEKTGVKSFDEVEEIFELLEERYS